MNQGVTIPLWALVLLMAFAAVTFASHFLFPSVRWFFRRRAEKLVAQLNTRLARPIQPFKLARRIDTVNRLTHDPAVAQAILDHARQEGVPEAVAFETARRYAREIVPGFSAILYFTIAARLAKWLSRSLYRVRVTGKEGALDGVPEEATVVYVLNHRSNMDYVLVTWLAADQTAIAYAVGEWARRFPLQPLIRAMGGYFVRRRDLNPLYRRVLARYVQISTRSGVTQAVFPEGRLSRDGALQAPKLGILSYIVEAHDPATPQDTYFVPVALNYERVLEDRRLIASRAKGASAFRLRYWMIPLYLVRSLQVRIRRGFTRSGVAAVSFGRPLSLDAFLAKGHADPTEALGHALMARIAEVLPVLPMALVCEALAQGARDRPAIAAHLARQGAARAAEGHPIHHEGRDADALAEAALRMLSVRNVVRIDGDRVEPRPDQDDLLRFYMRTLPTRQSAET